MVDCSAEEVPGGERRAGWSVGQSGEGVNGDRRLTHEHSFRRRRDPGGLFRLLHRSKLRSQEEGKPNYPSPSGALLDHGLIDGGFGGQGLLASQAKTGCETGTGHACKHNPRFHRSIM